MFAKHGIAEEQVSSTAALWKYFQGEYGGGRAVFVISLIRKYLIFGMLRAGFL
jgi:hypothetical protein